MLKTVGRACKSSIGVRHVTSQVKHAGDVSRPLGAWTDTGGESSGGNASRTAPRPWVQVPFDTETQTLWDRVRSHILIIDDYGDGAGAKKAVDEYFVEIRPRPLLHRIDGTGR